MIGHGVVTKDSPRSVTDTVRLLSATVTAKGMKVFAVIDHSAEARAHNLELRGDHGCHLR